MLCHYLLMNNQNPDWTWSAWQNTPMHKWLWLEAAGQLYGNQPEIQREQADWLAITLISSLKTARQTEENWLREMLDGVNDSNTFNSNKGCHIFCPLIVQETQTILQRCPTMQLSEAYRVLKLESYWRKLRR